MAHTGFHALRIASVALALGAGLVACAPSNTNTTYSGAAIGRAGYVSQGVIISMRDVVVTSPSSGVGTAVGVGAGGVAGSALGGGVRSNILGGIGGAVVGGLIGYAVDNQINRGTATEFILREDSGATISVVQTNEDRFAIGERVMIIRGDRTRLARPGGYAPGTAAPGAQYPATGYIAPANAYPATAYQPHYNYRE